MKHGLLIARSVLLHMQAGGPEIADMLSLGSTMLSTSVRRMLGVVRHAAEVSLVPEHSGVLAAPEQASSWGCAAAASLRLLPSLSAAADAMHQHSEAAAALEAATAAACECENFAADAAIACFLWAEKLAEHPPAAEQLRRDAPALLDALWGLHTAVCRLIHQQAALEFSTGISMSLFAAWELVLATGDQQDCR